MGMFYNGVWLEDRESKRRGNPPQHSKMGKLLLAGAIGSPRSGDLEAPLPLPSPLVAKPTPLAGGANF